MAHSTVPPLATALNRVPAVQLSYDRAGRGEPLVLIHGIGSRRQVWEPVLDRLTAVREVVALDLPGFGDAPIPPPPGAPAGIESLTRLVSEFLDGQGLECPHVAGNSLGGWISLELAKRGRARSVTALSPGGFYNSREATFARVSLQMTVRVARLLAPRADRLLVSPRARPGSTKRCWRPSTSTSAAASRSPCRSRSHGARRTACCCPARHAAPPARSPARVS